ncbi:MAG: hypothetical protein LIR50_05585 [Bacillota bacterium]|nr:hypothetical protein [Bacillota bacterium]
MKLSHLRTDGTTNIINDVKEIKEVEFLGKKYLRVYTNEINTKGKNIYHELDEERCKNIKIEL